jgi:NADPH2:quinone reductase
MFKRVILRNFGSTKNLEFENYTFEVPRKGEVAVEHKVIGLNFIDIYQRTGLYPLELPTGLGMEASGVVTQIGEGVTHLSVGDRVAYACSQPGAYSEGRVMSSTQVCKLPDSISHEVGAAAMLKGLTVQYLFHRTTPIKKGDTILFHAAAGGVGLIACQWAKSEGVKLIGTAGSDEKCEMAVDHGASHCINYNQSDFVGIVRELTNGSGVDVVMDSIGALTFDRSLDCLKPLGMMISFGNASGKVPPIDINQLAARGSLKVTRPTIFSHISNRDDCQSMAEQLFAKIQNRTVKLKIGQKLPLSGIVEAHDMLESRKTTGSTILIP